MYKGLVRVALLGMAGAGTGAVGVVFHIPFSIIFVLCIPMGWYWGDINKWAWSEDTNKEV